MSFSNCSRTKLSYEEQAWQELNLQPPDLESGALPIELQASNYLDSRCNRCLRQNEQNFFNSTRPLCFFRSFVVV